MISSSARGLWVGFAIIAFAGFPHAQETLTASSINGRGWKAMGEDCKVVYLMGFEDGLAKGLISAKPKEASPDVNRLFSDVISEKFSRNEIIEEIDKFYGDASNIRIPASNALQWVTRKMNGTPPTELENILAKLRQLANKH